METVGDYLIVAGICAVISTISTLIACKICSHQRALTSEKE